MNLCAEISFMIAEKNSPAHEFTCVEVSTLS